MSNPLTRDLVAYTVRVEAHHVPPRFDIREQTTTLYASSRQDAIDKAAQAAAREAGMGPWRPWHRAIAEEYTSVVAIEKESVAL